MTRRSSISVHTHVDLDDIFYEIDDEDLLEELKSRKINVPKALVEDEMDLVRDAYQELRRGSLMDAAVILERLLYPKWKALDICEKQYSDAIKK